MLTIDLGKCKLKLKKPDARSLMTIRWRAEEELLSVQEEASNSTLMSISGWCVLPKCAVEQRFSTALLLFREVVEEVVTQLGLKFIDCHCVVGEGALHGVKVGD